MKSFRIIADFFYQSRKINHMGKFAILSLKRNVNMNILKWVRGKYCLNLIDLIVNLCMTPHKKGTNEKKKCKHKKQNVKRKK